MSKSLVRLTAPFLALSLLLPAAAAAQRTPARAAEEADDDVVRVLTNLVQLDAVVTDRDGRQVTDLGPEDFEVFEEGKHREITNFSYISTEPVVTNTPGSVPTRPAPATTGAPPSPTGSLRPEQVRRTIVLVANDLNLAFDSARRVREAMRKFVDEQMLPGDLAAIIRTGGHIGALQQFTSDKEQLRAAVERMRYNIDSSAGSTAFDSIEPDPEKRGGSPVLSESGRTVDEMHDRLKQDASLAALTFVLQGLRNLPGRKSVVLFSDGLVLRHPELVKRGLDKISLSDGSVVDKVEALIDLAHRASAVFYTIDTRGLPSIYQAADNMTGRNPREAAERMQDRTLQLFEEQGGLSELARETGGLFVRNTNDIGGALRRVTDDLKGYYLIGYRPDERAFEHRRADFRRLTVKVKRPGLEVRTRGGFFNRTDKQSEPTPEEAQLLALASPFGASDVDVRLTALFANDERAGSYFNTLLHIDARDLTFTPDTDGWQKAVIELVALTFGDNGRLVDKLDGTSYTLRLRGETYRRARRTGFVHTMSVPVKKPGAYQLRVSVRDAATKRLGSAGQFIIVPDLSKNRLALSGILLRAVATTLAAAGAAEMTEAPTEEEPLDEETTARQGGVSVQGTAAARRFAPGASLEYDLVIYNARLDKTTRFPRLSTRVRLFRDGQLFTESRFTPADTRGQTDMKRIRVGGRFNLAADMQPGQYVMQVVVSDELAKEGQRVATQWIDFEVVGR